MTNEFTKLPQVDKVLRNHLIEDLKTYIKHEILAAITRQELAHIKANSSGKTEVAVEQVAKAVREKVESLLKGGLRKVINGTGVILNTNLGRAPLPKKAADKLGELLAGYSNLEIDLKNGKRSERTEHIENLIHLLTGAESAVVVNNNAAAVMLAVNSLAFGREVIVSRGELIEIGGSFRLPDVITQAGGILSEVGTTNRTRISDYQKAITSNTGILLKCHRSNFEITGFTEEATIQELVWLSKQSNIPLIEDLGSGAFVDLSQWGLKREPTVQQMITTGVDLVLFSADKLLGASQAGIIAGKHKLLELLRSNPTYRALRLDKLSIALVEYVLSEYLSPNPEQAIPALAMSSQNSDQLKERAEQFSQLLNTSTIECQAVPTSSALGGGTLPGQTLDSYGIRLQTKGTAQLSAEKLSSLLRQAHIPVITLVKEEYVILDFRTIAKSEEEELMRALLLVDGNLD